MRRTILTTLLLLSACLLWAAPACADELDNMNVDLCRQVMAKMMCKDVIDFNYVAKVRDGVYLFSTFYANKEAKFFCGVGGGYIKVQGKDFLKTTRTIPYTFDRPSKCSIVEYSNPECPDMRRIVVCAEKTLDEQATEDFWNRPIPDLLDEDLRRALEGLNATEAQ
ncbi:hypothetical protein [Salidesulfovibrio onnuriiensis]|uniref:hypothetical protein n=1 Tax=Salidesulfovibrio onnuriiensis TaxID=2583823 RepID=UPI0011CB02B3|nr:hypothetical protein [Salidesulfovibrio onnuriiensis]